jgi:hypothetical protein
MRKEYESKPINQSKTAYFGMGTPGSNYSAKMNPEFLLGYTMGILEAYQRLLELGFEKSESGLVDKYGAFRVYEGQAGKPVRRNVADITDRFTAPAGARKAA